MLIAGLSEFFILGAIAFTLGNRPDTMSKLTYLGKCFFGLVVFGAAAIGFLKFLDIAHFDTSYLYLKLVSGQLATTGVVIASLWPGLKSNKQKLLAQLLLISALVSLAANLFFNMAIVGSVIVILSGLFAIWVVSGSRILATIGLVALLSTLLLDRLVTDKNISFGLFHFCVGLYFFTMSLAIKKHQNQ